MYLHWQGLSNKVPIVVGDRTDSKGRVRLQQLYRHHRHRLLVSLSARLPEISRFCALAMTDSNNSIASKSPFFIILYISY
jgi:hypothetical protein